MTRFGSERFDVESSLPVSLTLPERRHDRCPLVQAHSRVLLMLAAVAHFKATGLVPQEARNA